MTIQALAGRGRGAALFTAARFLSGPLFSALLLLGCAQRPPQSEFVLGTFCTVNLYRSGKASLYREVFGRLHEIEGIMSVNLPGSDVSAVNAAAGQAPVPVRREVIEVLETALRYAAESGGAFDPSVGPLVRLWDIGGAAPRVPGDEEIAAALSLVDWRDVVVDSGAGTVFLRRPGMTLDLGGIAKGYAADEAAALLRKRGIGRAVLDLGGNVYVLGEKEGGAPWLVGIQNPLENRGEAMASLALEKNRSVVTSGSYERFFEQEGRRYHHILSTRSGRPAETGLLSVTIIAESSMTADALSTAAFALGWEQGARFFQDPSGPAAVFVFEDLSVRLTPGAEGLVTLGPGFRLLP
ncbi:MAG: FAD:protein FMN transferase [Spirochaetaceae bacterium]|nr:FAD:protein FMN transferase [Spirochaetaceae bacterium]